MTWVGDHQPRHVHVFRNGVPVAKWDLELGTEMSGRAPARARRLINELKREGLL